MSLYIHKILFSTLILIFCFVVAINASFIESSEQTTLTGTFEVLISDNFDEGTSNHLIFLREKETLKKYQLDLDAKPHFRDQLRSGAFGTVNFTSLLSPPDDAGFKRSQSRSNTTIDGIIPVVDIEIINDNSFLESTESIDLSITRDSGKRDPAGWTNSNLRRLLVVIVNFQDDKITCPIETISSVIWGTESAAKQSSNPPWSGSVFRVFQANSQGQVLFERNYTTWNDPRFSSDSSNYDRNIRKDIVGPVTLNRRLRKETQCFFDDWADEALQLVESSGTQLSLYNQVLFMVPDNSFLQRQLCGWNGLAYVGCDYLCRSWISGCRALGLYAHELGHNMGLAHSGSHFDFEGKPSEYGDPTAIMGNRWGDPRLYQNSFFFNAPQRISLGWLPQDNVINLSSEFAPSISYDLNPNSNLATQAFQNGSKITFSKYQPYGPNQEYFEKETARIYRIYPFHYASVVGLYQAIRISRTASSGSYYLSYQADDAALYRNQALLHYISSTSTTRTSLIAVISPFYDPFEEIAFGIQTLLWRDPDNTFALRVLQSSSQSMDIQMTWKCQQRNPVIKIVQSPVYFVNQQVINQTIDLNLLKNETNGTVLDYIRLTPDSVKEFNISFEITNMDSDQCKMTQFEYGFEQINLITSGINNNASQTAAISCPQRVISLIPGQTCTITCLVKLPSTNVEFKSFKSILAIKSGESLDGVHLKDKQIELEISAPTSCRRTDVQFSVTDNQLSVISGSKKVLVGKIINLDTEECPNRIVQLGLNASESIDDGWQVQLSHTNPIQIPPSKSFQFTVDVIADIGLEQGNSTEFTLSLIGITPNITDPKLVVIQANVSESCVRNAPSFEMLSNDVTIYPRSSAKAAIRLINMDSPTCSATYFSTFIEMDPLNYVQSSIFPNAVSLNPGESFDFVLSITSSNLAQTDSISDNLSKTKIKLTSSRHDQITVTQNTRLVPVSCFRVPPSMGISCPPLVTLNYLANPNFTSFQCNFAWRNNDPFLCKPTTWNLTINMTEPDVNDLGYPITSTIFRMAMAEVAKEKLSSGGQTSFQSFAVDTNVFGLLEELNETNYYQSVVVNAWMIAEDQHPTHNGLIQSLIKFGLCIFGEISVNLSPSNPGLGPYADYYPEYPLDSPADPPDFNPIFQPDSAPILESPYESPSNFDNFETAQRIYYVANGVSQTIYFKVFNPGNEFCSRDIFTLVLSNTTRLQLSDNNIPISAPAIRVGPGTTGEYALRLQLLANPIDTILNVTVQVRYAGPPSSLSGYTTVFLNITSECTVKQLSWSKVQVDQFENSTLVDPIDDFSPSFELNPSAPQEPNSLNSLNQTYSISFEATIGERKEFYTILNLTNLDSEPCGPRFAVDSIFELLYAQSPSDPFAKIDAYITRFINSTHDLAYEKAAVNGPWIIPPQQFAIFNISFHVPANMDANNYTIELHAFSRTRPEHNAFISLSINLKQPARPRPVWDIHAVEQKSPVGISIGFDLEWRACERSVDCICPCKYHLYRNDVLVTTTSERFYPYRYSMTQAGVQTRFEIQVEDKFGQLSTKQTCGNTIAFVPSESKNIHLVILIVIIGLALFPALVTLIEALRARNTLPSQSEQSA